MKKIFCDICKKQLSEIYYDVRTDDPIEIIVGKEKYKDVCARCLKEVAEFVNGLKK